jgi:V8-like Glu-specific endopeptidase
MAKKRNENLDPMHFWGSKETPDNLEKLLQRRFILGDQKDLPAELKEMRSSKDFYINTGKGGKKPEVQIQKIREKDSWKVSLPVDTENYLQGFSLAGNTANRLKPEKFLSEINPKTLVNSFRPSWTDASYSPRMLPPKYRGQLRRINGKFVNPLYVFGTEDRWAFRDSSWPWGLVGRVFTSRGTSGTGVLIGDRTIVTAGHMVPWGDSSWWMRFVPAYYDGDSLHGAGVQSYVSDARGYDTSGDVTGYDWAVCRLYTPLGNALGYFGFNGYSSSWNHNPFWSIIGYPGAIASAQRPSFQGSVTTIDTDGDSNGGLEIETRADLTPGNSGGPQFGWWGGDPRIVGVVSGEEEEWSPGFWPWEWADTERVNVIAGGSGFTNLVAWARTNWPL